MASCCDPRGCDGLFTPRFARRMAGRYRRRGLDRTARRMVAFLEAHELDGTTVLEIGGGVGEIQIELLRRGAARSLNLELSPAYEDEARRLLRDASLEERAERRLHDIARDPEGVAAADVVVLHRVVCCYPDYERLLAAAAQHARRVLVFSYPPWNAVSRLLVFLENAAHALLGKEFRAFVHPPSGMLGVLEANGLRPTLAHRGLAWHVHGLERAPPGPGAAERAGVH